MKRDHETCAVCGAQGFWTVEYDEYGNMICDDCNDEIEEDDEE
jgi:hypothetical protein